MVCVYCIAYYLSSLFLKVGIQYEEEDSKSKLGVTLNHPYFFALENFQIVLLSWLDQIRSPNPIAKQPAPKQSVVPLENTIESSYSSFF